MGRIAASGITTAMTLLGLAAVCSAQGSASDYTMTTRVTGIGARSDTLVERFLVSGSRLRMEISTLPAGSSMGGMYVLVDHTDSSMRTVMPGMKMVMLMRMPKMPPDMSVKVSRDTGGAEMKDLGVSDIILGYSTHHFQSRSSGTTTVTIGDRVCTKTAESGQDMWITDDTTATAILNGAYRAIGDAFVPDVLKGATRTGGRGRSRPSGIPLRTIMTTTVLDSTGKRTTSMMTTEYTELSRQPLDSALFQIPADFHVTDMRDMVTDLVSHMADAADSTFGNCVKKP